MTQLKSRWRPLQVGAVLSLMFVAAPVSAQQGPRGPGMMMGPGAMGQGMMGGGMCDPRAAGLAQWRNDRIERMVRPTEAQRPAVNELKAASTKAADIIAAACPRETPATPTARLEATEKRLDAMLQAVKIIRPAFDAFYASLTNEQKAAFTRSGPQGGGWRGWRDRMLNR